MGRGDIKSKKGKIFAGSFGKSRPAKNKKTVVTKTKEAATSPPAKKTAAKKEK